MYERIPLQGSYIKSIKDVKLLDYDMTLSYDHTYRKFYGLVASQNTKVVLVAQDMSKMAETCFEQPKSNDFEEGKETLQSLLQKTLSFFMSFERIRYSVPWRWRRWTTVFSTANDTSAVKESKILKRFEKVRDYELNEWRNKFGLNQIIISNKGKKGKNTQHSTSASLSTTNYFTQSKSDEFLEVPIRIEERKVHAFCISGDVNSLRILFTFLKEVNHKFIEALKRKEIKKDNFDTEIVFILLKQLAYWVRISDTLIASPSEGDPELLNEVSQYLYKLITTEHDSEITKKLESYYRLIWVVMINGFEIFFRSAESQFNFIKTLLSDSFKYKKLNSNGKRNSLAHYNYYYDCFNTNLSPIQLFHLFHYKYPSTFLFRVPLVSSEIKEYSVKFKRKTTSPKDQSKPYTNKFMQKQPQFFSLISMGGVLECNLNEIVEDYKRITTQNKDELHLESIQEMQTCYSVSQKDFSSPFSMYFLLDQKISLLDEDKKEDGKEEKEDEETQIAEDYAVNLYLQLFQDKSISNILRDEGYQEEVYFKEVKEERKAKNKQKGKKKIEPSHKGQHGYAKIGTTLSTTSYISSEIEDNKKNEEEAKKEKEEKEGVEKRNKLRKREILREVHRKERELHQERTKFLWDEFTHLLVTMLDKAKSYGNIDFSQATNEEKEEIYYLNNIRYLWKIFIRMVEDSLAVKHAAFHNSEKNREFLVR